MKNKMSNPELKPCPADEEKAYLLKPLLWEKSYGGSSGSQGIHAYGMLSYYEIWRDPDGRWWWGGDGAITFNNPKNYVATEDEAKSACYKHYENRSLRWLSLCEQSEPTSKPDSQVRV